jgi:GT2 family glycosyltransferase
MHAGANDTQGAEKGIWAAILAYNRLGTLERCLEAVLAQDTPPGCVLVFDNGSTDETPRYLARMAARRPEIRIARSEENLNAAAGMARLLELALEGGARWIWTMDDDIVPEENALSELFRAFERHFRRPEEIGFLISLAVTPAGAPTGMPQVDTTENEMLPSWAQHLADGLVRVRTSTMSSMLMPATTLRDFGGLNVEYRIYGEDTDFALRVTRARPSYLVGRSRVVHLMAQPGPLSIVMERDPARLPRYWYLYRNTVCLRRTYWPAHAVGLFIGRALIDACRSLFVRPHAVRRAAIIVEGLVAGFFFRPDARSIRPRPVLSARDPETNSGNVSIPLAPAPTPGG